MKAKRNYFILSLLILCGVFLNIFAPRLFMGFNYLFGSIPVLIVLHFYGIGWGTLAGLIAGSWTYFLFGHPYAIVWLTMEPFLIGLALRFTSVRNLVLLNTIYWPVFGIPLLWLFFKFVMGLPFVGTLPAALMFWLIGIANSLAATIIIQMAPLAQLAGKRNEYRIVTMRQAIFSMMMSLVVLPAIIIMVINGRAILTRNENNIINRLHEVAGNYEQRTHLLLKSSLLMKSGDEFDPALGKLSQATKEFIREYLTKQLNDEQGMWITLLDHQGKIIFTNTPRLSGKTVYYADKQNQVHIVQKGVDQVLPPMPTYITLWRRVQNSWYKYEPLYENEFGLRWIFEIPFAPYQKLLLEQQTHSLQVVLFLCLAALTASFLISHRFNRSILELAKITTGLAERVEKDKTIIWPETRLGEVKTLSDNFRLVADTLRLKFRQLRQSYESMEEKVADRTLELRTAKEQAERLYRMMPSALFAVDQDRRIIIWNKKAEQITGYTSAEAVGQKCLFFSAGRCINSCLLDSEKQIPAEGVVCPVLCKDGREVVVSKNIDYLIDGTGKIIGGIESFEDITEKLKLEERLRQAHKMESIGTLAGGIAHDFNNILFPILGHTGMLIEDISPHDKESLDRLNQIYSSALRARDLIQQILTFSHQEQIDIKPIKIQLILKETIKLLESTLPKNIEIQHAISKDCRAINSDPTQIHQILMNLTTNAWHAMGDEGGELKIQLDEVKISQADSNDFDIKTGNYACLSVSDSGIGMSSDLIEKIFDPYFTTKEKGKGTGMGLSVVHGIVEKLRGYIKVDSESGKGTTFKVYFPVNDAMIQDKDGLIARGTIQVGAEHILLIDDEEAIIKMLSQSLERLGYEITSSNSPIEALEIFQSSPQAFDLIVTDMSMPKISGDKLASKLLAIRADIPIVVCTGYSENFTAKKATAMGIRDYVMKPLSIQELSGKIRKILDKS